MLLRLVTTVYIFETNNRITCGTGYLEEMNNARDLFWRNQFKEKPVDLAGQIGILISKSPCVEGEARSEHRDKPEHAREGTAEEAVPRLGDEEYHPLLVDDETLRVT